MLHLFESIFIKEKCMHVYYWLICIYDGKHNAIKQHLFNTKQNIFHCHTKRVLY